MPTYVYRCKKCSNEFEQVQKMSDPALTDCPNCDGQIGRVPFPVGVVFKGSGFYVNDNSKCNSCAAAAPAACPMKDSSTPACGI